MATFIFKYPDGTKYKEYQCDIGFYVPPKIVLYENTFFLRTSCDAIADPVEFILVSGFNLG